MVHERQYVFLRLNVLIDVALAVVALVAAYYTRSLFVWLFTEALPAGALTAWLPEMKPYEESHLLLEYLWLFPTCALLWPLALNRLGYYDLYDLHRTGERRGMIVKACAASSGALIIAIFVFKLQFISRIALVGTGVWSAALLLGKEAVMRGVFLRLHAKPEYLYPVLLVGEGERMAAAAHLIEYYHDWGLRIVKQAALRELTPEQFTQALIEMPVAEVVFAVAPESYAALPPYAKICEQLGLKTRIVIDVYTPEISKLATEQLHGIPLLTLNPTTQNFGALTFKLFADRVIALVLLALLSPLLTLIAAAVKLTSAGPVLFRQERCGLNGARFILLKFRSMVADADQMKPALEGANEMRGWAFKIKDDPRVTPVGRLLRRFSLDELPQLWNVLRGDMSLVGPRPARPEELERFHLWERRRLSMKPGMTGLWQVTGRNRIPNEQWVARDLQYIDTWSLGLDLRIMLKTIWVVLRGEGM